jgi:hypothetical protein
MGPCAITALLEGRLDTQEARRVGPVPGIVYFDEPPIAKRLFVFDHVCLAVVDLAALPRMGMVRVRVEPDVRRHHHLEVLGLG